MQRVEDGNDVEAIDAAIQAAIADPRPSLIAVRTTIGYGSPNRQGTSKIHGEPLGDEELNAAKDNLGWPKETRFLIPGDVLEFYREDPRDLPRRPPLNPSRSTIPLNRRRR